MNPTEHTPKTPRSATGLFALLAAFLCIAGSGASAALPATAAALPAPAPENLYSSAPGLPDGRVYEQVSPTDKHGNEAGAQDGLPGQDSGAEERYALATADGNSVLFEGTGPMGTVATGLNPFFVASKNAGAAGWTTRGITPAPQQSVAEVGGVLSKLHYLDPSLDLSHAMFVDSTGTYAPGPLPCGRTRSRLEAFQMYLAGPEPFVPATWLERPEIADPIENCQGSGKSGVPVGGTPDFSTVYFTYPGTLLPEDESRAPHAHENSNSETEAWGFYEDREGTLREAGTLPADSPYPNEPNPFGAVPAASGHGEAVEGNQVSSDGSRAFFLSPDPASCEQNGTAYPGHNNCALDPPQLYVRENGERTQLVSQDTLLPAVAGLPAPAPDGALPLSPEAYVFASPDGSQAFFQSEDQLTPAAPSGNATPKTYDFDVDTGTLTYLPGVVGQILTTDTDGSSLAFVKPEAGGAPAELALWSAGPAGGSVTPVAQLPGPPTTQVSATAAPPVYVSEARMSSAGSVLVFLTSTTLPGAFNSGGFTQIYRYDAAANTLGCVSCPPHGVTPNSEAVMSPLQESRIQFTFTPAGRVNQRGISADGDRVFFDTQSPLVPQDTNTGTTLEQFDGSERYFEAQGRDVYEWENGVVYLISSGKSSLNSYFLDNSEDGDDVFFATTEGLVPGDTDGAYDVYDARVPQPGDNPPPAAVPCEGAVCQGPPNVPAPLTPPASATFTGLGNPAPEAAATTTVTKKTTKKTVKCKKGYVKNKKNKCVKKPKKKQSKAKKSAHINRRASR